MYTKLRAREITVLVEMAVTFIACAIFLFVSKENGSEETKEETDVNEKR